MSFLLREGIIGVKTGQGAGDDKNLSCLSVDNIWK
jgi:hypothetical protein